METKPPHKSRSMRAKLDTKFIASLQLGELEEITVWDTELPRFAYRLRPGSGSYIIQYRYHGSSRRLTIGKGHTLSPTEARAAAKKLLSKVTLGEDPQADKNKRRSADKLRFSLTVEEYLGSLAKEVRPKTLRESTRYLTGPHFKLLHGSPLDSITRRDVATRLVAIERERTRNVAKQARAALSAFFRWAVQHGLAENNPVIGTKEIRANPPRSRVLTDDELVRIWRACGDDDIGRIVRLLTLWGVRRQEVGSMEWDELHLDAPQPYWLLPKERAKNGREHKIPILPMAADIIKAVPRTSRRWVFGSYGNGYNGWSNGKAVLAERSGIHNFVLHDIRRTLSTKLHEDLGVQPHVVEALLNHTGHRSGTAGVYNRASYDGDKRVALAKWEDYLCRLLDGGERKVVPIAKVAS